MGVAVWVVGCVPVTFGTVSAACVACGIAGANVAVPEDGGIAGVNVVRGDGTAGVKKVQGPDYLSRQPASYSTAYITWKFTIFIFRGFKY